MVKSEFVLPGEEVLLKEVIITQGLLFILVGAIFVFVTKNLYVRLLEYVMIIWYSLLWASAIKKNERRQSRMMKDESY